jgi:biopolymer transport protein ExbD
MALGFSRKKQGVDLNMSPLIDMVFILLIFFLVTTSFVKESAVEVKRPIASNQQNNEKDDQNMFVSIDKDGYIFIGEQLVDVRSVRSRMERWFAENPLGNVVIMSDTDARWGVSIEVLDEVRQVGIKNVVVTSTTG